MDYFAGVDYTNPQQARADITTIFRRQAKAVHPDTSGRDGEEFRALVAEREQAMLRLVNFSEATPTYGDVSGDTGTGAYEWTPPSWYSEGQTSQTPFNGNGNGYGYVYDYETAEWVEQGGGSYCDFFTQQGETQSTDVFSLLGLLRSVSTQQHNIDAPLSLTAGELSSRALLLQYFWSIVIQAVVADARRLDVEGAVFSEGQPSHPFGPSYV